MKVGRVIQLVLAVYGTWSLLQGISFNRTVEAHQCSQERVPVDESLRHKLPASAPTRWIPGTQSALFKHDARMITLLDSTLRSAPDKLNETCSLTQAAHDAACELFLDRAGQSTHFVF